MKNYLRAASRKLSPIIFAFIYGALTLVSLPTAFKFVQRVRRLTFRYPNFLVTPHWRAAWNRTNSGWVLCHPLDWVAINLVLHDSWEPTIKSTISTLLKDGDTFVDIGAHIGSHSLTAAQTVGPTGHVIAFEPLPANLAFLSQMIVRNRLFNVTLIALALADRCRVLTLHAGDCENLGQTSIRPVSGHVYRAITTRFDQLIPSEIWPKIRMIKMDVEGAEAMVIAGMERMLSELPCDYLICEITDEYLKECGSSAFVLIGEICKYGYISFLIDKQSSGSWKELEESSVFDKQVDMIFVKSECVSEFVGATGATRRTKQYEIA